ncbi:MAG TPA: DNA polymerase III subunit gamma/tau [Candidatus Gemmiger avium]|nr:DNA polymerase III subunit gamma/tau [Candidatus Gemmiger avium]
MYQALYRKWRPAVFEDVVGQSAIVSALKNQVATGRVGHAYLFTGTRGTGKTTCARIFAKAVNCTNPHEGNPCGECAICRGVDDGSILDVIEIDAASNNGVDSIRDLRDETAYTPSLCRYKVYIIDEVHMLSTAAFNALLKTMEEPPSHVIFILATTEIHKVPATILSRCQRYDFGRIRPEDIAGRVRYVAQQENLELDEAAAMLIARLADGALRDALSILDTCAGMSKQIDEELVRRMAGVTDRSYLFAISDAVTEKDPARALAEIAQLRQRSVDLRRLCEELISHYRNLMLAAMPGGKALLTGVSGEEESLYLQKCSQVPLAKAVQAIRSLGSALEKMSRGTDPRIELELALFSLTEETAAAPAPAPARTAAPAAQPASQPFVASASTQPFIHSTPPAQQPAQTAQPAPAAAPAAQPAPAAQSQEQPSQPAQTWAADVPFAPVAKRGAPQAPAGEPQLFPQWSKVLEELEKNKESMLFAYLEHSRAFFDGRRVLIDAGNTFRDFIRVNKEAQELIKQTIQKCVGVRCGIGPYEPPKTEGPSGAQVLDDTLKTLKEQGVPVIYHDKT